MFRGLQFLCNGIQNAGLSLERIALFRFLVLGNQEDKSKDSGWFRITRWGDDSEKKLFLGGTGRRCYFLHYSNSISEWSYLLFGGFRHPFGFSSCAIFPPGTVRFCWILEYENFEKKHNWPHRIFILSMMWTEPCYYLTLQCMYKHHFFCWIFVMR